MARRQLKFVGGPLDGQIQTYAGDENGPGTWKVRVNDERAPGRYKQKSKTPNENGTFKMLWQDDNEEI